MIHKTIRPIFLAIASYFIAQSPLYAAAFQLYELGTPIVGTAGVGQAAITDDAATAYFNPAGMGFMSSHHFMLGSQAMIPAINFSKHQDSTISGDNGDNAGSLTPGMNMFIAYNYSPCLKFGFSVTTPYGGSLNYNDGWVGRYVIQEALFYTIHGNLSMAYLVNDWLAVGLGASVEYMNLHQNTALPFNDVIDGQVNLKLDDVAAGFNLGVMIMPSSKSKIGIAYRSKITHHLDGDITFYRITTTPDVASKMVMPQNVIMSLSHDISDRVTLLAEAGWADWSSMKNTILQFRNISATIPRNWNDTYRFGVGGQFKATPSITVQAGASYDTSPVSTKNRLPDLPMDRQYRIGTGVVATLIDHVKAGLSYEYMNMGQADINFNSVNGLMKGHYDKNFAHTLQASIDIAI